MIVHGTAANYDDGCRCRWCVKAKAAYRTGNAAWSEQVVPDAPIVGVCMNGPAKGCTFTDGGALTNVDGWLYGSDEHIDLGTVGYRWLR